MGNIGRTNQASPLPQIPQPNARPIRLHSKQDRRQRPCIEPLESRQLLSAQLVKDINQTINPDLSSSFPHYLVTTPKAAYFLANDGDHGTELWKTDGTKAGTVLVRDITAGQGSTNIDNLINVNGLLFFIVDDTQLWKSNGTRAGTSLVKEFSSIKNLVSCGGSLYFTAEDNLYQEQLWQSNGRIKGTVPVMVNCRGYKGYGAEHLINVGETLFFTTSSFTTSGEQTELWKSTSSGASKVAALPGSVHSVANNNGKLLFFLSDFDARYHCRLWTSDGTSKRTRPINHPAFSDAQYEMFSVNGMTYFLARSSDDTSDELWCSNGTKAGTHRVTKPAGQGSPQELTVVNGRLCYVASTYGRGMELWTVDESQKAHSVEKALAEHAIDFNGTLFFLKSDELHNRALWRGNRNRTSAALAIDWQQLGLSSADNFTVFNNMILFSAQDALGCTELYRTDGTPQGTRLVKDINACQFTQSGVYGELFSFNNTLYFSGDDASHGGELWKSDGTSAGTVLVKDTWPGPEGNGAGDLFEFNGEIYFTTETGNEDLFDLWKTDGTEAGTQHITTIPYVYYFQRVNDTQFAAVAGTQADELWLSDGTADGTFLLMSQYSDGVHDLSLAPLNDRQFIIADSSSWERTDQLRVSDGTDAETTVLKEFDSASIALLGLLNGSVLFVADGDHEDELWRTDGTEEGTVWVSALEPSEDAYDGPADLYPEECVMIGDTMFFAGDYGLWKTDGTLGGTILLNDSLSSYHNLVNLNGTLFFAAEDGESGSTLWRSDGTAEGTVMVKDPSPSDDYDDIANLTPFGGKVYFIARLKDSSSLYGLWQSDGTEAGTLPVDTHTTLDASWLSSLLPPSTIAVANNTLFFIAQDDAHGQELWKLATDAPPVKH